MLLTDARMDTHTDNVKTVYPPQTNFAGGINILVGIGTIGTG